MYAAKRRHLPAYAENPFTVIGASSIPVEDVKANAFVESMPRDLQAA
jgi:hypothetical protein